MEAETQNPGTENSNPEATFTARQQRVTLTSAALVLRCKGYLKTTQEIATQVGRDCLGSWSPGGIKFKST